MQEVLRKLRVTDEYDRLSLTNLIVFVAVAKLATAAALDYQGLSLLITAVAGYQYRKSVKDPV